MAVLDSSIVNIALPSIARDLHIRPSVTIGLVTIYQLVVVTTLLPLAALGDTIGHARIY